MVYDVISFPGLGLDFTVSRVAFSLGPITVYWYGLLDAIGILLAAAVIVGLCKKYEAVRGDTLLDGALYCVLAGFVGARIYYVIFALDEFRGDWMSVFYIWNGGLAIYGGIIAALITAYIYFKRIKKLPLLPYLDLGGIGLLIGQGIGRWGNFVNQEAFGSNTTLPWGMTSDRIVRYLQSQQQVLMGQGVAVDPSLPVHPCFLYESLWCVIGLVMLLIFYPRRSFDGQIFFMYVGWYALGRVWIEMLRTDSLMLGPFRVSVLVSIAGVLVGAAGLWLYAKKGAPLYREPVPAAAAAEAEAQPDIAEEE